MCTPFVKSTIAALAIFVSAAPALAEGSVHDYDVEAAFIYNFTQFITWPEQAFASDQSPFIVGIVGDDPLASALDAAMAGKNVLHRPVVVKHFASVDQLESCQLLYVPTSQGGSLSTIFEKLGKTPVLTVDDTDSFMAAGGGIRFFLENNKVRFEIDPDATEAAGLKVSSRLMKLARIYKR